MQTRLLPLISIPFKFMGKDILAKQQFRDKIQRNYTKSLPFLSNQEVISPNKTSDSDVFGTLKQSKNEYEFVTGDEGDRKEEERIHKENPQQLKINKFLTKEIKMLLKKRKLSEALNIIDSGKLSKPDAYVYGMLIRACGYAGYSKKAFKLYNDMKKRGIKPRASVYTSLFNCCSHSPWKEDGISRASHLLESFEDSGYEPNSINYNAMIKAFGRCGDLSRSFRLVDQMIDRGLKPDASTFAFLLQACASDKETGFRHAILVWDKMMSKGIEPTVYTYNLMLRCCKDCDSGEGIEIGKLLTWKNMLQIAASSKSASMLQGNDILTLPLNNTEDSRLNDINISSVNQRISSNASKEDIHVEVGPQEKNLRKNSTEIFTNNETGESQIIVDPKRSLIKPVSPEDRLQCMGGCSGFLEHMDEKGVKADIKTFTQLLMVIPSTAVAEKELMLAIKKHNLPEDVEFYNMLIKKRIMRFDYDDARLVLKTMSAAGLHPNIMTFGILAMGCRNREETLTFVDNVKEAGFRMNAEIIGALISGACYHWDIHLVLELMEICIKEEVRPNSKLVLHLKNFRNRLNKAVEEAEKSGTTLPNRKHQFSLKSYNIYKMRLSSWLKEIDLSEADDQHPWDQFRRHQADKEILPQTE